MKHRLWLVCACLLLSTGAVAYEFWLQPTRFFAEPGDVVQVRTLIGNQWRGELSEGKKERVVQYKQYTPMGEIDLATNLTNGHHGEVAVKLNRPGTHLLVFANTPKFISMEPDEFLTYLNTQGLDNVIAHRFEQGDTLKRGYELYSRCAKAIIQVGEMPDETLRQADQLMLDIVPMQNPYALRAGQRLRFQVRYDGNPRPDALVTYCVKSPTGALTQEQARSDSKGFVQFKLRAGQNLLSTVTMAAIPPKPNVPEAADWRSYWGSLTFGCRN